MRTVSAAAGRARIRAGMMITEARSRCAQLHVFDWSDETIGRSVARLSAAFIHASPQVTPVAGAPGMWWIGASGFDAAGGDAALAQTLHTIATAWHPQARVSIADSCVAARAATWQYTRRHTLGAPHPPVIVPPGRDAAYLAAVPLGLLPMDSELRESLRALGLRTGGAFVKLDAEDVERRWGAAGLEAWRLAQGDDPRRPGLARIDAPRTVSTDLHPSAENMEPILFLAKAALERLVPALIADGRAAAVVTITLVMDDTPTALPVLRAAQAHTITREIRLPRPIARVAPLLERCRALFDDWPLNAPVCGFTLAITATAPLNGAQGELLDPAWRDPAAADAAFARLRATLGMDAIVRPVARDTHRPERAAVWERVDDAGFLSAPDPHGARSDTQPSSAGSPTRLAPALRQLTSPEQVAVEATHGVPQTIQWRDRSLRIHRANGPERLAGDWWDLAYSRDYWRCDIAESGLHLMIYHDLNTKQWFVESWYD